MKRLFIYSMLVASSLGAMTSCSDFLDVKPVGAVSEEELLNQEGVNYAITGMYSSMLTQEYYELGNVCDHYGQRIFEYQMESGL